ncbi:MAG: TIGR02147 family protein [Deltaproteobacteria bacterium]|nr:TIGR02147 family protein [Deltaproteobacteria bacterium]
MNPSDGSAEADAAAPPRPVVARYTDYREYLKAMYDHLKVARRGFSYRSFAKKAGFSSGSFLKLVIDGKRNLSPESIPKVAHGLGLDAREADVLEALVLFEQAPTDAARDRWLARLGGLVEHEPAQRLALAHYDAYTRWYPFIVRELAGLPGFEEDPAWIGRRLRPRVRPDAVARAVTLLERVGLLVRGDDGRLAPAERTLSTGAEVRSLAVRNFHRRMLELSAGALDQVPPAERNISSVTVALDSRGFKRVVELTAALRQEILRVESEGADAEPEGREVYHMTLALIPVTQPAAPSAVEESAE